MCLYAHGNNPEEREKFMMQVKEGRIARVRASVGEGL